MIIINDTLGTYGGSITLIERLCTWCTGNSIPIKIYCENKSNKEITKKLDRLGINVECFDTSDSQLLKQKLEGELKQEDVRVISFTVNNYLNVEKVKKLGGFDFANVIYSIHPATFYKGTGIRNKLFLSLIKKRYKRTIERMNANGAIVFMDTDNIEKTEQYYEMKFQSQLRIQALPMICKELPENELDSKLKKSFGSRRIITACRADFPFKGYVFGLVDDFVKLKDIYPELKLTMVCSGDAEDVAKICNKINQIPDEIRKDFEFYNWMEYQKLNELIKNSYLYVGMGTGVVDAALVYVPSIAVMYNTYDNESSNVFCDKPDLLVADNNHIIPTIQLMRNILDKTCDEYGSIAKQCFASAKEIYDIERFINFVLKREKKKSYLNGLDVVIHSINTIMNKRKNMHEYSVENIEYEEELK